VNATAIVIIGSLAAGAPVAQPPEGTPQASAQAQPTRPAPDPRRQDIQMMEIALTRALQTGARQLAQLLRVNDPTSAFVTEIGRARGFILDGYGIFFDVDVPGMKQSVVWSAQVGELARDRERTVQAANAMAPDDARRGAAYARVRQIDRLIQALQAGQVLLPPPPSAVAPTQVVAPNRVEAMSVNESVVVQSASPAVANLAAADTQLQDMQIRDPNELYTESVKNALIDAMLGYSKLLKIAENEWLTVAASDSDGPTPGQLDDTSRILISIRGTDLAAYQAGKLTRDEVLKKVVVKEF
jgi:hypothetical protein